MGSLLPVTKAMYDDSWLMFEEADIRKACRINGCPDELIDECIEQMKEFENDCVGCYVTLVLDLNRMPEYERKSQEVINQI